MTKLIVKHIGSKPVSALVGHMIVAGKSGSGKSNACEWICTQHLEAESHKIIDVYDSGRFENMLYGFAEDHPFLINKLENFARQKPRGFKNEIIVLPGPELKYTKRLPVDMKVMSFDINDLRLSDLWHLLGRTDKLEGVLATISNSVGDDVTLVDFHDILLYRKYRGQHISIPPIPGGSVAMIVRNVRRWLNSGIFSDKLPKINFQTMLSDTSTITSFSTFLQESEEVEAMIYGLILKKVNEFKRRRRVQNRVLVYFREVSEVFKKGWELPRAYVLEFLRQGRDRGIDFLCDTQRVLDLDTKYRRQFGMLVQMRTDEEDFEKLSAFMSGMPSYMRRKAPAWGPGEGILMTGAQWEYPLLFPPTAHRHKRANEAEILQLIASKNGWKEYSDGEVDEILRYEMPTNVVQEGAPAKDAESEAEGYAI